jgi:hypothetical protein
MPLKKLHKSPFIRDKQLKRMRLTQNQYNWLEKEYNKLVKTTINDDYTIFYLHRKIDEIYTKAIALSKGSSCSEEQWEAAARIGRTCKALSAAIESQPQRPLF